MSRHGKAGPRSAAPLMLLAVLFSLAGPWPAAAPGAWAADVGRTRLEMMLGDRPVEAAPDSVTVLVQGEAPGGAGDRDRSAGRRELRDNRIVGTSFFASGVFLCSWGITSWQDEEYQCCPPRNTENVIKIVVGVVLLNAGLFYLLGGAD